MDSAFKICFAGISSFQTIFYLENDKLAYVGFGFCLGGEIFFKLSPQDNKKFYFFLFFVFCIQHIESIMVYTIFSPVGGFISFLPRAAHF